MNKKNNFEDKMNRLKDIVDSLEKEDIDLDASISMYEEGLKITKDLKDELKKYEDKIKEISLDNE